MICDKRALLSVTSVVSVLCALTATVNSAYIDSNYSAQAHTGIQKTLLSQFITIPSFQFYLGSASDHISNCPD